MSTRRATGQEIGTLPRSLLRVAAAACLAAILCLSCQNSLYTLASQKKIYDVQVSASRGGLVRRASETPAAALAFTATNNEAISLTAVPNKGWAFSGWTVADSGSLSDAAAATTTLTVAGAASTVSANFIGVSGEVGTSAENLPADVQFSIAGPSSWANSGNANFSFSATLDGADIATRLSSATWRVDGRTAAAATASAVVSGWLYGVDAHGGSAADSSIALNGSLLSAGSYRISCEVVYRGYAYSASMLSSCTEPAPGSILWSASGGGPTGNMTPAIGLDGSIYIAGSDGTYGRLFAFASNGAAQWDKPTLNGGFIDYHPAIAQDGTIYITESSRLERTDASAANPLVVNVNSGGLSYSPAIDAAGYTYTTNAGGTGVLVVASKLGTSATYSSSSVTTNTIGPPSIGEDGTVYFSCADGYLYAYTASTSGAAQIWRYNISAAITAAPAIDDARTHVYTCSSNTIYCVSTTTHSELWEHTIAGAINLGQGPVVGPDGRVYIVVQLPSGAELHSYDSNGNNHRSYAVPSAITHGAPAVASDGTVYFCAGDAVTGALFAIGSTGTYLWSRSVSPSTGVSSPAIGADGTIYFGTTDGTLYAVKGGAGPATEAWPMLGCNARRTSNGADF